MSVGEKPSLCNHVEPLTFDYRALNPIAYEEIRHQLTNINWDQIVSLELHSAYLEFVQTIQSVFYNVAPIKAAEISSRPMDNTWYHEVFENALQIVQKEASVSC